MKKILFAVIGIGALLFIFINLSDKNEKGLDAFFSDVAKTAGVENPSLGRTFYNEQLGEFDIQIFIRNGSAWGDVDNDVFVDLYVANPDGNNSLYVNNCDGTFADKAESANVAYGGQSTGVSFGDIDNDGCVDLFVANHEESNILYKNNCDGTFVDVTKTSGVLFTPISSTGSSWVDFNNDGFLDIFVTNISKDPIVYELENIHNLEGGMFVTSASDQLFKNNGDGTFTDVAKEAGVGGPSKFFSYMDAVLNKFSGISGVSYSSAWFDYNNDNCMDLMIASDSGSSPLYKNNCDGTFTDMTVSLGIDGYFFGMGIGVSDINNDSFQDIYLSNAMTGILNINENGERFSNKASEMGIREKVGLMGGPETDLENEIGWGATFLDYDNDGDKDLYVVASGYFVGGGKGVTNLFYRNENGMFVEDTDNVKLTNNERSYGLSSADYDNDGDIDLYVTNATSENNLFMNESDNSNHFISIRLQGVKSNRLGIGAKLELTAGGKTYYEQVKSGMSLASQNDYSVHFGLGNNETIDSLTITWPSGTVQKVENIEVDQIHTIIEGDK